MPTNDARCLSPRVLITAGPTHEPIDRVRYIGNRSSGRMGIAIAHACIARGWPVTLLWGPIDVPASLDTRISMHRFQTTADLRRLLAEHWPEHDLLFMAAAVADYTVKQTGEQKLKRGKDALTLELVPTPDLLAGLASMTTPRQTIIGFALEPAADLEREALRKLKAKRVNAIVANPLETMESPTITASLVLASDSIVTAPPGMLKEDFADWLLDHVTVMIKR